MKEEDYEVTKESMIEGYIKMYLAQAITLEMTLNEIKKVSEDNRLKWKQS